MSLDNSIGALLAGTWSESVVGGGYDTYTIDTSSVAFADMTNYTFTISGFKDTLGNEMDTSATHVFTTDFTKHIITATAGTGGTITPSGAVRVIQNTPQRSLLRHVMATRLKMY